MSLKALQSDKIRLNQSYGEETCLSKEAHGMDTLRLSQIIRISNLTEMETTFI